MKNFSLKGAAKLAAALSLGVAVSAQSATYQLPKDGSDVVGFPMTMQSKWKTTFSDIAQKYDIPYLVLMAANPGVDPWVPGRDRELNLPTQIILPDAPRSGIVINVAELRLYYYPPTGDKVEIFPIGIGRVGWTTPIGTTKITRKKKDPTWTPPASIRREHAAKGKWLPSVVPAGPQNPLGKHAMRLGFNGAYLIHGTNKDFGVGMRVSHGCIRMYPEDIEYLFSKAGVGTKVTIVNQPYKVGYRHGHMYAEAHEPLSDDKHHRSRSVSMISKDMLTGHENHPVDTQLLKRLIRKATGVATPVSATHSYVQQEGQSAPSEWPVSPW